jgi:hypothetical protein
MTTEFKVGDRVQRTMSYSPELRGVGTIVLDDYLAYDLVVLWDGNVSSTPHYFREIEHVRVPYTIDAIKHIQIAVEALDGRQKAHTKHGDNSIESIPSDDPRWLPILAEEFGEVAETLTYDKGFGPNTRAELVDLITVGLAWIARYDYDHTS